MYPYDPARANKLLDEAGLPRNASGVRFGLGIIYEPARGGGAEIAAALKNTWGNIGVDLKIEAVEPPTSVERVGSGKFDIFVRGFSSAGDPALGWATTFVSSAIDLPGGNGSRYSNPEIDDLFTKAEELTSLEDRGAFYRKAQTILAKDLPVLTIHEAVDYEAQSAQLKGLEDEYMFPTWRDAWLDR
jgi:peptide/nickel transport system substrate-binding protein